MDGIIGWLGTGRLGSNMVRSLLCQGWSVRVWNRTSAKAEILQKEGAVVYGNLPSTVDGVNRIHLTLRDDESVDEVLDAVASHLVVGAVIIDHTTTSVSGAIHRSKYWHQRNVNYLHAPVFMSPKNASERTGAMLVSGDQQLISNLEPDLRMMTSRVINYGPDPGRAAAMKLARNLFVLGMNAALLESLTLATSLGIHPKEIADLFTEWNPGAVLPDRINKILNGQFDVVDWELQMARKDAELMINEAAAKKIPLSIITNLASTMDQCIESGYGTKDWTIIGKQSLFFEY